MMHPTDIVDKVEPPREHTWAKLCMLCSAAATSMRRACWAPSRKSTYRLLALSWLAIRNREAATCSYICSRRKRC